MRQRARAIPLICWVLAIICLPSCKAGTAAIKDHLELSPTHQVAGQSLDVRLVIDNPGGSVNLTDLVKQKFRSLNRTPVYEITTCSGPRFIVDLIGRSARQDMVIALACSPKAYVLRHGRTVIPFPLTTTYTECLQRNGQSSSSAPVEHCVGPNGDELPPLPPGRYRTKFMWTEYVPLPSPPPVTVVLTRSPSIGG